jgi:hypothetical protein
MLSKTTFAPKTTTSALVIEEVLIIGNWTYRNIDEKHHSQYLTDIYKKIMFF